MIESPLQTLKVRSSARFVAPATAAVLVLVALAGCSNKIQLMPTPNLYLAGDVDPFPNVPPEFQNNKVDVLYFTDRAPEIDPDSVNGRKYGYVRSRSVAFGVSQVEFGHNISWEELDKASRARDRSVNLEVEVVNTNEIVRFPLTPRSLVKIVDVNAIPNQTADPAAFNMLGDEVDAEELLAEGFMEAELSAQLAKTTHKEVYLFIHGYNNTFDDGVETIAQLWHFFGRQGVPIAYTWPAGSSGILRGYNYDSASSEFTVFHLKQMLLKIAKNPDVKKINIICHSRGTDTTINALRELYMEIRASGRNTRELLKLGTLVLAAPDIDLDIVMQKLITVRLGQVPERFAMYINSKDGALGLSSWLFGGLSRLGEVKADMFTPQELELLRTSKSTQIIDAHVSNTGAFGHDYFHSNPAVSSDLILFLRYQLPPGAEYGRPLQVHKNGFWMVEDGYPGQLPPEIIKKLDSE
ncbi:MAG: alpha/beta hydrolase [Planctomycetes bacterium]|nr:alpha/beta hydrolase [Planctomycetota bacterium]